MSGSDQKRGNFSTLIFICFYISVVIFAEGANYKKYSNRYINDYNITSPIESNYDYADNTKLSSDNLPYHKQQASTKIDENFDVLYPDPEDIIKSRMTEHHDDTVVKIYTTRIRQPKRENNKVIRINQTHGIDDMNNADLNSHDFIDSIMFIYYYGKNVKSWKDLGSNIIIIGAGFSIFAQTLTIILVSLRIHRMRKNNAFFPITMNLLVMLFLSNLLFIVGVQSNKNAVKCEIIALILHYLNLTTSVWCFVFIFIIYDLIINESLRLKMRFILLFAYVAPAIYVLFSYAASSNSLEYQKYCFMSIHKNMIINFLVPVFVLIVATTILGTLCLKHIKDKNRDILNESVDGGNVNSIGLGIVMNNGQNIERFLTDKDLLAAYYLKAATLNTQLKCCEEQHEENYFKSKTDIYDSKFDLGQLSLADLSQTSSTESTSHDYTNFKSATKFALFFQPLFATCWFVSVLALENIHSYVFPTIFAICFNILNWSILLKSRSILPFMKHFYDIEEGGEATANEQTGEECEEDHLSRENSKNLKNNKNLLNQMFFNSTTESSMVLTGSGTISHRTDQIPLLYQTQFNHRKSIANLELTQEEYHIDKHKNNSLSEHDLVYQQRQQQFDALCANGKMDNLMNCCVHQPIRSSWDANLDRVSTISN